VLLHPTALAPGSGEGAGGALGAAARAFIDWLAAAGYSVWQVLPLGPTGADASPYWARSDHAGNPRLIDWSEAPDAAASATTRARLRAAGWLEDYALSGARRRAAARLVEWPVPLRDRAAAALAATRAAAPQLGSAASAVGLRSPVDAARLPAARRAAVRRPADLRGAGSAATWARAQFQLDAAGGRSQWPVCRQLRRYGRLWGNPLYDWERAGATAGSGARLARQLSASISCASIISAAS
jgi:4-alpha-glucanotransferase